MQRFSAEIYKIGINPVVDPPDDVLSAIFKQAKRGKGPIPVKGVLNGAPFNQTLVRYAGAWRLYVNGPMLAACGLSVGDRAEIELEFDPVPRNLPVPQALTKALESNRTAKSAFDQLPPSRRKEIVRYIGSLKTEAAIEKNVARVLTRLAGDH